MPPRTIAFMNQKGGVGKTTVSINLAHAFARAGVEFRPKERFAFSLFGQLNQTDNIAVEWTERGTNRKLKIMELDFPAFILDSAMTFYF